MKIWQGYGSEHSMNLVMIGRFKEVHDAEKAKKLLDRLIEHVNADPEAYRSDALPQTRRFDEAIYNLFKESELFSIGLIELEQFTYDVQIRLDGTTIELTTDEVDVSAFIKILLDKGARIELYSAHHHPRTADKNNG